MHRVYESGPAPVRGHYDRDCSDLQGMHAQRGRHTDMLDMTIAYLSKENPVAPKNVNHIKEKSEYDWCIVTLTGSITFKSVGYNLFLRRAPVKSEDQSFDIISRGGVSFDLPEHV